MGAYITTQHWEAGSSWRAPSLDKELHGAVCDVVLPTARAGDLADVLPELASTRWRPIGVSVGGDSLFIDMKTLRPVGDMRYAWVRTRSAKPSKLDGEAIHSYADETEANCAAGTKRIVGVTSYGATGDVVDSRRLEGALFRRPTPETVGEKVFEELCRSGGPAALQMTGPRGPRLR